MTPRQPARAVQWLRAHPLAFDAVLAVVVLCAVLCASVTVARPPDGGPGFGKRELPLHTLLMTVLACAVLVQRRRYPMTVLSLLGGLSLIELILGTSSHSPQERHVSFLIVVVVALFTVAVSTDRSTTWRAGLVTAAVFTPTSMMLGAQPWYDSENLGVFAWTALAAASGEAARSRRAALDAIRERAERAERTREEEAHRRVAEERMRIARELHDVVAHHIALVNVQAGVASHVMDSRPDQAKEALGHIREASRRALGELQTTVGLLRHRDEPIAPTEPARGLGVLQDLVDGFTRAGMAVTVDAPAAAGPLPSAVDLAAYRVVQEALTNVHKHAGPGAGARVRIVREGKAADAALDITVDDDGPGVPEPRNGTPGSGHGLTGMRERAAALSGTCEAGPRSDGGFRVRVTLPLQPPRPEEPAIEHVRGWCV
ncbi:sensor histidine kinase [Streptomyces johnsoniae]|uniref:histidine kinase n=1 Tax=Streptomyces johnsoniae TaxID=3075532 RepID=A0ABU2S5A7_9ACTN|nr:sensor histidine kinase [Streptomyces sp. DSM 41886]MDT0444097.1 sensor histidine kinase [Streptomyces sp. DSM 41886]